ncbi:MAG TPA: hypothetical protein VGG10_15600 [Rhizomicrobium sp.]|jgi:hypothetical protein
MIQKTSLALLAALAALGSANSAQAIKAGSYSGSAADGTYIAMTVTGTGPFTITGVSVNYMAPCKKSTQIANEGWGFYVGTTIVGKTTDFVSHNDFYYIHATADFSTKDEVTGLIGSRTAVFTTWTTLPTDAAFCVSPTQAYTLKYQGPVAPTPAISAAVLRTEPSK